MLFANVTLAARIERAECRLLADCAAAAERRRPEDRAYVQEFAGGVATYTGPESPFNKIAGLGFADALDEERLAQVERAFAARGTPVQAEVAVLGDPSVCALLTRRGYVLENFENVLGLRLPPRTYRTSPRASTSRSGPRSITTSGSTSSWPASPTRTRRGSRRTRSSRGTCWTGRSATWPRSRDSLATLHIETASWPVPGACASATGLRNSAALRRHPSIAAAVSRPRCSPPDWQTPPARAATLPSSPPSRARSHSRMFSGAASICCTLGRSWCEASDWCAPPAALAHLWQPPRRLPSRLPSVPQLRPLHPNRLRAFRTTTMSNKRRFTIPLGGDRKLDSIACNLRDVQVITRPIPRRPVLQSEAQMRAPIDAWLRTQGFLTKLEFSLPWGICDIVGVRFRERSARHRAASRRTQSVSSLELLQLLDLIPDRSSGRAITLARLQRLLASVRSPSQVQRDIGRLTAKRLVYSPRKNQLQKATPWRPLPCKIFAVEMKLRKVDIALAQACSHLGFTDASYVAFPQDVARRVSQNRRRDFLERGVGILSVTADDVRVALKPCRRAAGAEHSRLLQIHCAERFWAAWLTDNASSVV